MTSRDIVEVWVPIQVPKNKPCLVEVSELVLLLDGVSARGVHRPTLVFQKGVDQVCPLGLAQFGRCHFVFLYHKGMQGLFLDAWLGTHTLTMSRDVTDIHGELADFASGEEVVSFFIGLFWRKKGLLAFWEGALSPSKSPPKKSKGPFFEKTNR